jgi:ADP-ribose pyrophosphatase YjhB (NUDIX family)
MHYLQKGILDALRYHQHLSYTALMPDGIESSNFQYHLKQLIKDGLVKRRKQGGYGLTHEGRVVMDYLSEGRVTPVRMPKIITYTLITSRGRLLLYRKNKDPYRGLWGLIGGKIHFGENVSLAAQREVLEKTGARIPVPEFVGVANIVISQATKTLSQVTAYVHTIEIEDFDTSGADGMRFIRQEELSAFDLMPDFRSILRAVSSQTRPFVLHIKSEVN